MIGPPQDLTVCEGDELEIWAAWDMRNAIADFLWLLDGVPVFGPHQIWSYRIASATPADEGTYSLMASNECTSGNLRPAGTVAHLRGVPGATITQQPPGYQ